MSASKDPVEAKVLELLPQAIVRVELVGSHKQMLAHIGSAKDSNFVRVRPGDMVLVAVADQDPTRGRIISVKSPRALKK